MNIYINAESDKNVLIELTREEARNLHDVLVRATEPAEGKPIVSKRSKAWKLAFNIADLLPIW